MAEKSRNMALSYLQISRNFTTILEASVARQHFSQLFSLSMTREFKEENCLMAVSVIAVTVTTQVAGKMLHLATFSIGNRMGPAE